MSYNAIVGHLNKQNEKEEDDPDSDFTFNSISSHRKVKNQYEDLVEWETGEATWEPIALIRSDDPFTLAKYDMDNGLLNEPGRNDKDTL